MEAYTQFRVIIWAHDDAGTPGGPKVDLEVDATNGTPIITDVHYSRGAGSGDLSPLAHWDGLDLAQIAAGLPKVGTAHQERDTIPEAPMERAGIALENVKEDASLRGGRYGSKECERCHRMVALRKSGNLAAHNDKRLGGRPCLDAKAKPVGGKQGYRRMPADFPARLAAHKGTRAELAKELGLPPHTVNSWAKRLGREAEIGDLPIHDPEPPAPTPAPAPAFSAP